MHTLARPNMAVNDPRVRGGSSVRRYRMWNTWDISATESRQHIVNWVATVVRGADGGKLRNLVLSCHGLPGVLQLGEGFNSTHLALFASWRGLVEKVWLPNCLVARIPDAAMQARMDRDYPGTGVSDGNVFCSGLAKQVRCYVVAATELQCESPVTLPVDQMTSFEGLVLSYGPDGNVTWSHRNPSTWFNASGACVPVPD
jgi:hypothetical protein